MKTRLRNWHNSTLKPIISSIKDCLLLNDKQRPLADVTFMLLLALSSVFAAISIYINDYLNLPDGVKLHNYLSLVFFILGIILSKHEKRIGIVRFSYMIFVLITINFTWLISEGSLGPTLLFVQGFLPLVLFSYPKKFFVSSISVILFNILSLYCIELYFPELIHHYISREQNSLDVFIVFILFLILELPILIFAKNRVLKQRNEAISSENAKTSLIANLSHEIRTPMNAILGFAELMVEDDADPIDQKKYLNIISHNGRTLLNLLNNVINLSKIESNKAILSPSKCNVTELLSMTVDTLQPLNLSETVNLKADTYNFDPKDFTTDGSLLFQILVNLGYNAIKFTNEGHINVGAKVKNNKIIFYITDTGSGINEQEKNNIFERFKKLEAAPSLTPTNGAGLGLSICLSLTKLLNGKIWFESEEQKGTTFYVELPLD